MKQLLTFSLALLLFSCLQTPKEETVQEAIPELTDLQATMIEVELKDSISLFILLAKDGTINRKGDLKTRDKNFFMGMSTENQFDKLVDSLPKGLTEYFDKVHLLADTTKKVNKIKIAFSGLNNETGFEYYTDEPLEKLPKPILDFINNAIQITDPWFKTQQEMIKPK